MIKTELTYFDIDHCFVGPHSEKFSYLSTQKLKYSKNDQNYRACRDEASTDLLQQNLKEITRGAITMEDPEALQNIHYSPELSLLFVARTLISLVNYWYTLHYKQIKTDKE